MNDKQKKLFLLTAVLTTALTATVLATLSANRSLSSIKRTDAVVNVNSPYSLVLDSDWGYSGETTKTFRSARGSDFTIGFSDSSKFGHASENVAFTTTEGGLYLYNVTPLNGVTQLYVDGNSSNGNESITVYSHYNEQSYCEVSSLHSERVIGSLNTLISFEPTKYLTIRFDGIDSIECVEIGYSCQTGAAPHFAMHGGGQNTDGNGLFQSMTGLASDYSVGTAVHVKMDVQVTGTFDSESCEVYWVDQVWSSAGGESDKARTSIKNLVVTGDSEWHSIEFDATIRNFPNLRFNTKYTTQSTSRFGNAVYLIAVTHASLDSFDYRNVVITKEFDSMIDGGTKGTAYHQTYNVLTTDMTVGTSVSVGMDIRRTGTFDKWSSVGWVNGLDGAQAATRVSLKTEFGIASDSAWTTEGWYHVNFVATVRNFAALRKDANYSILDTSSFGNGVYLVTENNDSTSFDFKNVVLEVVIAAPAAKKDSSGNYYTSYIGFSANGLSEGANVHVSLYMYYTGGIDSNTVVYALDKSTIKWGGGAYADGLNMIAVIAGGGTFPTTGFVNFEFDTKVYTHSNAIHWGDAGATFDVSTYGVCTLLCFKNATNATSPAIFKNVVITAI